MQESKGLVFDIKKFAVHDGHGLRTTVFLKGCPLRCKWCQNPEGLNVNRELIYLESKCIHCKECIKHSEKGQLDYKDKPIIKVYPHYDNLIKACPTTALTYNSTYYETQELLTQIKKDEVFYRNEGGVTFSGGEPLLQYDFLKEMLHLCHQEGIHTAIETTAFISSKKFEALLDDLDLIYIDMKVFDESKHQEYTGVSNNMIKENISHVLQSKHKDKVIIRTPLIPGFTATKENLTQISEFLSSLYSDVHYELLNYNPLASNKYKLTEYTYGVSDHERYTNDEMNEFYSIVEKNIKNLIK